MGTNWTEQQCAVIDNRGGTLLVSAAAGSGKTAVLVERVLRRVSDPENPCDIDSFLIVTYTRAAAGEMRGKIGKDHLLIVLEPSLFLLHGDTRPVSYILIGTGQRIKQCCLAAIRVAGKRELTLCHSSSLFL